MAKAIISNRIYLDNPGEDTTKAIVKELTYKVPRYSANPKVPAVEIIKNYKLLPKGIISIPATREDLIPPGYEIVDKRIVCEVPFPDPIHLLREAQQPIYDVVEGTCFINALPGWGKTFTALHLARKLGQKTLVVTHTTNLRDQWIDEVEILFGMKAGVIGSGKFDIEDHAITIGNIQSLKKYLHIIDKEFGLVIIDECHHVSATTFTDLLDKMHCKYRIGLSGTMIRKDGKHITFKDYFGHNVYTPPASDTMTPTIKIINTGITLDPKLSWVDKITQLTNNEDYRVFVANVAKAQMNRGHSVLIIADRVDFLEGVSSHVGDKCVLVTGASTREDRQKAKDELLAKTKLCVAGSRQIFSEGISINVLSCVILAVPMANDSLLEQIVGRINRMHPDKPDPLVIDMNFSGWSDKRQNNTRMDLYIKKGWPIQTI